MILITGTTGFIGSSLINHLYQQGYPVTAAVRCITKILPQTIQQMPIGDLLPSTNWTTLLNSVNTIIHLAALAHFPQKNNNYSAIFYETNTYSTLNFAQQAAEAGVRRFIFISSIGVNGNQTFNTPFTAENNPSPKEPYAISKYEAEIGLREIASQTGMEIVIIRPPLVYGPNAPGNFARFIKAAASGLPLPLGSIHNQRSLVALDNLIDLITLCIDHPAAANQTFLVSDGEDLSTTDLLRRLGSALNKSARLLPVPQVMLTTALHLLGKETIAQRLCGNLQVDISKTRDLLGWQPIISVDEALQKTAHAWLAKH